MTRKPDWQALLDAFLAEHQFDTFQYGRWDCCLFVCDAVLVMTGVDPAAAYRGTYSSRAQSRRHGSVQANVEAEQDAEIEDMAVPVGVPHVPT